MSHTCRALRHPAGTGNTHTRRTLVTETSSAPASLSTMRMAELQQLAASMGLKGISRMRKSELITAIRHSDRTAAPQIVDDAVPGTSSKDRKSVV